MMKLTNSEIAKICHEANRAYCQALGDFSQDPWDEAPEWQKVSAVVGVNNIMANPHYRPEDSHESWLAHKRADGWKYGPEKNVEAKEHPCMVPYAELSPSQRMKDHIFTAIVKAFYNTTVNGVLR